MASLEEVFCEACILYYSTLKSDSCWQNTTSFCKTAVKIDEFLSIFRFHNNFGTFLLIDLRFSVVLRESRQTWLVLRL